MDFSVLSDVVINRNKIDLYMMGLLYSLGHSIVDVTYAGKYYVDYSSLNSDFITSDI